MKEKSKDKTRDKNKRQSLSREQLRAQLTAQLADRQRQLSECSDKAAHCEKVIGECREQLDEGRDRKHIGWLIPTLILFAGGGFLLSVGSVVLSVICFAAAAIAFFRWLAAFSHCLRKYGRITKRLRHNIDECDRLNEKASVLRLETLELRQQLDRIERE